MFSRRAPPGTIDKRRLAMNNNYEWQQQHTNQRIQKRLRDSQQHCMSKKQKDQARQDSAQSIIRLPLRLVTAILSLGR
jgi:hypothetical protein